MDYLNKLTSMFDMPSNMVLNGLKAQSIIRGLVYLFLIIYSARLAPTPPKYVLDLFNNVFFKLFVFALIIWSAQVEPSVAILLSLAFMITINYTTTGKLWEMMDNTAPTLQDAIQKTNLNTTNMPVVNNVSQDNQTTIIKPSIVNTPNGPQVINPSVVVAPSIVSTPSGQSVMVTPQITTMTPSNFINSTKGCYTSPTFDVSNVQGLLESNCLNGSIDNNFDYNTACNYKNF